MRLIDADALEYKHIQTADNKGFIVVHAGEIDSAPTAYDLEKVIKQLEERIENYKNLNSDEEIVDVAIKETERIIEIVKAGGVGNGD